MADERRLNPDPAAVSEFSSTRETFVATARPDRFNRRLAGCAIVLSVASFLAIAPFAHTHLVRMAAFIPSYEAAVVIIDLMTAVLLVSQFTILRRRSLLAVACAYLASSLMVTAHAVSFPLGAGPHGLFGDAQTTGWLYVFWHAAFPLLIGAYAFLADSPNDRLPAAASTPRVALAAVGVIVAGCAALTFLAASAERWLPILIVDGDYSRMVTKGATPAILAICVVVIVKLWRHRNRSVLDLWLFAVLWVWLCDVLPERHGQLAPLRPRLGTAAASSGCFRRASCSSRCCSNSTGSTRVSRSRWRKPRRATTN